jgi:hypothetical protein
MLRFVHVKNLFSDTLRKYPRSKCLVIVRSRPLNFQIRSLTPPPFLTDTALSGSQLSVIRFSVWTQL